MSLITRCPACGTMFKVVPDQLRVSDGWVRCGNCAEVFEAPLNMPQEAKRVPGSQDGVPHVHTPSGEQSASVADPTPAPPVAAPAVPAPAPPATFDPQRPSFRAPEFTQSPTPVSVAAIDEPNGPDSEPPSSRFSDSQLDRSLYSLLIEEAAADSLPNEERAALAAHAQGPSDPANLFASRAALEEVESGYPHMDPDFDRVDEALESVSFVRDARRQAMWRRPGVRIALSLCVLLLLCILGVQIVVHERNRIAAMEPRTRPLLQALCSQLQCVVEPLRQIESIVIDSSAFTKLRADTYRLSITVKNNAALALAMPAIELALTDSADQPIVRRVLMPADLGAAAPNALPVLPGGGEWSGVFPISIAGANSRVVGYRLLAFYP